MSAIKKALDFSANKEMTSSLCDSQESTCSSCIIGSSIVFNPFKPNGISH